MEKLIINHLAPYLPYELEAVGYHEGKPHKTKIDCTNIGYFTSGFAESKPILRPLSDLAKEIEIDGVTICPLMTLYNIGRIPYQNTIHKIEYAKSWDQNDIVRVYSSEDYCSEFVFGSGSFYYRYYNLKEKKMGNNPIDNQITLFNKLYEWHFDVFGLIPKCLAADTNTL